MLLCRDLHFHLDPMEVCLEETFVEEIRKFMSLLPLKDVWRQDSSAHESATQAEKILGAMLKLVEANTTFGSNSTVSTHRW
jgi:hypothetical protein